MDFNLTVRYNFNNQILLIVGVMKVLKQYNV